MQKCGGRIQTEEEIDWLVRRALDLEEKKEIRRLGRDWETLKVDAVQTIEALPAMDDIVRRNHVSATNSLSQVEWLGMEAAMPPEERQTHRNLQIWMMERARSKGIAEEAEGDEEDEEMDPELAAMLAEGAEGEGAEGEGEPDDDDEEEPSKVREGAKSAKEEEDAAAVGTIEKTKNWSSVNLAYQESKLAFRGLLTPLAFTNWLWYRCVRPRLEEAKSKLPEVDPSSVPGVEDCEEIFAEFVPAEAKPKEKKEKDEKKGKDEKDKKDKKGGKDEKKEKDDKKSSKKDEKDDKKSSKKKKDQVVLNSKEKLQAKNLLDNMVYGLNGKGKTITTGWVNMIDEKEIPVLTPWEFQIAHILKQCLALEYATKKKKENPDFMVYYEMCQALADGIGYLKKQYAYEFPETPLESFLPLSEAIAVQKRFMAGSVGTLNFDLLWYLQHGAHLLAGSAFAKKHTTTVFKPFLIQEKIVDAITKPGPQCVFGIAPPGTGKTAVVAHLLNLFPGHTLVFCCAALPVVLGVGRISNTLGIPYAFVKGRRITPSYSCGRGLGTHVDDLTAEGGGKTAVESLKYLTVRLNLERKKKRLAEKKRKRHLHDLKRNPRMFLMCDTSSCAWLLRQLEPCRTILVIDEPPMGSDSYPETPESNPLACAMVQAMMTPAYKTLWMSATLPRIESLPTLVNNFMDRFLVPHEKREEHVTECFSTQLDRGALLCGPSGAVAFPHLNCRTAEDLTRLCTRLPADPLVLKSYTERALASILVRWQQLEAENAIIDEFKRTATTPQTKFADLSDLNHNNIRGYAVEILEAIAKCGSDDFVEAFCAPRDEGTRNTFPAYSISEMMFSNAYAFPGLTLVADDEPSEQMLRMAERLLEVMPKASDLEDDIKAQEVSAAKESKFADDDEIIETSAPRLKFNAELVIQSEPFLRRWCPSRPDGGPSITRVLPTVKEFLAIKELPVDERWQMLALSGAGSFDPKLDSDPSNPVYTQWVHEAMTSSKLACVTAGKEFTWGANVPASTVVVTKSFAETTSVAGMLQYVGRAARRGLTTHGQAIFERDEDLNRIFASPDGLSTEALTMERYAKWWQTRAQEW